MAQLQELPPCLRVGRWDPDRQPPLHETKQRQDTRVTGQTGLFQLQGCDLVNRFKQQPPELFLKIFFMHILASHSYLHGFCLV
ncbi:MAG: hypothetical protein C0616_07435 [Desulfuromonas sp.]|nr:MAG: hypothetical protein C0616_07435 [Desulfuromonas sp.]